MELTAGASAAAATLHSPATRLLSGRLACRPSVEFVDLSMALLSLRGLPAASRPLQSRISIHGDAFQDRRPLTAKASATEEVIGSSQATEPHQVQPQHRQSNPVPFYYPGRAFAELGIAPEKLLLPGDPDTYTVKIREVMPVGYFVDMPNGREGYLPANDLGFSGGIERLRTIFQVGQEVVVRITFRGGGGRELLSIRKYDPERPPVEPPRIARSSGSPKHRFRHRRG